MGFFQNQSTFLDLPDNINILVYCKNIMHETLNPCLFWLVWHAPALELNLTVVNKILLPELIQWINIAMS